MTARANKMKMFDALMSDPSARERMMHMYESMVTPGAGDDASDDDNDYDDRTTTLLAGGVPDLITTAVANIKEVDHTPHSFRHRDPESLKRPLQFFVTHPIAPPPPDVLYKIRHDLDDRDAKDEKEKSDWFPAIQESKRASSPKRSPRSKRSSSPSSPSSKRKSSPRKSSASSLHNSSELPDDHPLQELFERTLLNQYDAAKSSKGARKPRSPASSPASRRHMSGY